MDNQNEENYIEIGGIKYYFTIDVEKIHILDNAILSLVDQIQTALLEQPIEIPLDILQ